MSLHVVTLRRTVIIDIAVRGHWSKDSALMYIREQDTLGKVDWDRHQNKIVSTEYSVHEVEKQK